MTNSTTIIDMRGIPYQTCWGCDSYAGGHEGHIYYGNFPLGVIHSGGCGAKIQPILDRSLRALKIVCGENNQILQLALMTLIHTSANKLGNLPLNQIEDTQKIRNTVENNGMEAALSAIRSASNFDDAAWHDRLVAHSKIMKGPVLIKEEVTEEDKANIAKICRLMDMGLKRLNREE